MAEPLVGYEMMVIFKPLLPDDVRKGSHNALVELVKKHKGDVVSADVWGKRYLSYPIMSHDEGYYIVYELALPSASISDFTAEARKVAEVLRLLITKIQDPDAVSRKLNKKVIDI